MPLQPPPPPTPTHLTFPSGRSKSTLLGFYDPAMGEKKRLRIRYRFRGKVHEAVWEGNEAVALPMRSHMLESEGR